MDLGVLPENERLKLTLQSLTDLETELQTLLDGINSEHRALCQVYRYARLVTGAGKTDPVVFEDLSGDERSIPDLDEIQQEFARVQEAMKSRRGLNREDLAAQLQEVSSQMAKIEAVKQSLSNDLADRKRSTTAAIDLMCAYFVRIIQSNDGRLGRIVSDASTTLDTLMMMKLVLRDAGIEELTTITHDIESELVRMRKEMDCRLNRVKPDLKVELDSLKLSVSHL